jgi:hypothetical protein
MYRKLILIQESGSVSCIISGQLEFLEDPFSRIFDTYAMVPRVYLRVTNVDGGELPTTTTEVSVAVSFVSDYEGAIQVYATYVTFQPNVENSFQDAISWMKREYVEGEYRDRILTDFDQTQTTFPEAKLALSKVMDRQISRGALRETVELMHATGSFESYFDELDRREFLRAKNKWPRTKIFINYAHAAENGTGWVKRMRTHLEGLAHASEFEVWDDTRIAPGERWKDKINEAIDRTKVAILVLTADFLASKFIRDAELPPLLDAADAEGATILCIFGSRVHLSGIAKRLKDYQVVNSLERPLQELGDPEIEAELTALLGLLASSCESVPFYEVMRICDKCADAIDSKMRESGTISDRRREVSPSSEASEISSLSTAAHLAGSRQPLTLRFGNRMALTQQAPRATPVRILN